MPPPATSSEFLDLLERSRVADPVRLKNTLDKLSSEGGVAQVPADLAEKLREAGVITSFHVEQLLAGRHKGFVLGKYKILALLGSGGMGRVYLGEHAIMRRQVALKVLPKQKSADP